MIVKNIEVAQRSKYEVVIVNNIDGGQISFLDDSNKKINTSSDEDGSCVPVAEFDDLTDHIVDPVPDFDDLIDCISSEA